MSKIRPMLELVVDPKIQAKNTKYCTSTFLKPHKVNAVAWFLVDCVIKDHTGLKI